LLHVLRHKIGGLPAEFRFEGSEVLVWADPETGNVVLSKRPPSWDDFFELRNRMDGVPDDFLSERFDKPPQERDL